MNFQLFRVPIRVGLSFWLFMGALAIFFTDAYKKPFTEATVEVAGLIVIIFFSILIQSVTQSVIGRRMFGSQPIAIIDWAGSTLHFLPPPTKRSHRLKMAFIGPAINLLLALSFYFGSLAILSSSPDKSSSLFIQLCVYGALINTMWFILNILPVSPLPGGQVLQVVLNSPKKGHFISMLFAAIISIAALAFNQLVITLFFGMFAFQNFKAFQHFKRLENEDH